tara:strand:- start:365 stop:568 length:204 start_codon:yes stop_codon:yes gene_type:complete
MENKSENVKTETSDNKVDLLTIEIDDENKALNVLIGYLGIAQRRGCFAINESSKIYEAIRKFQGSSK